MAGVPTGVLMTTIRRIHDALQAALTDYGEQAGLTPSADPFTFDHQPRTDFDCWYVDPPLTRSEGIVGGVESVTATVTVWVSREAGQDAQEAALGVADDLAHLRHRIAALDVGPLVNVQPQISTVVQPRRSDTVTVIGRLTLAADYEATPDQP